MIKDMNDMPALQAYRLFLRGYTRPARYVDGIISTAFTLPPNFQPPSVYDRQDIELQDFFSGFDTRNDILDGIDRAVADACAAMSAGLSVSSDLKRLVCYACWGNPIDAFSMSCNTRCTNSAHTASLHKACLKEHLHGSYHARSSCFVLRPRETVSEAFIFPNEMHQLMFLRMVPISRTRRAHEASVPAGTCGLE
jgi:hypothetical protein